MSDYAKQQIDTPEFEAAFEKFIKENKIFSWNGKTKRLGAFRAGAMYVYEKMPEKTIFNEFLAKVFDELKYQDNKWGKDRDKHPLEWQSILIEEVGEVGKEINDNNFNATLPDTYEAELIQVAACVFRMYQQNRVNMFGKDFKKGY